MPSKEHAQQQKQQQQQAGASNASVIVGEENRAANLCATRTLALSLLRAKPTFTPRRVFQRVSIKIEGVDLEDLTSNWRNTLGEKLGEWLPGAVVRNACAMSGCIQIIAEVELDAESAQAAADALMYDDEDTSPDGLTSGMLDWVRGALLPAMAVRAGPSGLGSVEPMRLQLHDDSVLLALENGPALRGPRDVRDARAATLPGISACSPAALVCSSPVPLGWRGQQLAAVARVTFALAAPLPPGCSVLGRHAGEFVHVRLLGGAPAPGGGAEVTVEFEVPSTPGVLSLELHHWTSGLLGRHAPLLLLPSALAAADLDAALLPDLAPLQATIDAAAGEGGGGGGGAGDDGSVGEPQGGNGVAAAARRAPPDMRAFSVSLGHWLEDAFEAGALCSAKPLPLREARARVRAGARLLRYAAHRGMPGCAVLLGDVLVRVCSAQPAALLHAHDPDQWLAGASALPAAGGGRALALQQQQQLQHGDDGDEEMSGQTVLHLAVLSGRSDACSALTAWGHSHGVSADWSIAGPGGLTPLHLAALSPAAPMLVPALLRAGGRSARSTWAGSEDDAGATPAEYARQAEADGAPAVVLPVEAAEAATQGGHAGGGGTIGGVIGRGGHADVVMRPVAPGMGRRRVAGPTALTPASPPGSPEREWAQAQAHGSAGPQLRQRQPSTAVGGGAGAQGGGGRGEAGASVGPSSATAAQNSYVLWRDLALGAPVSASSAPPARSLTRVPMATSFSWHWILIGVAQAMLMLLTQLRAANKATMQDGVDPLQLVLAFMYLLPYVFALWIDTKRPMIDVVAATAPGAPLLLRLKLWLFVQGNYGFVTHMTRNLVPACIALHCGMLFPGHKSCSAFSAVHASAHGTAALFLVRLLTAYFESYDWRVFVAVNLVTIPNTVAYMMALSGLPLMQAVSGALWRVVPMGALRAAIMCANSHRSRNRALKPAYATNTPVRDNSPAQSLKMVRAA
ncbi:hypothetical protein FOA52_007534 [Chlamydomonas sp. UWO 241]|nr:hypothetical protein FOA52_007534 [Chlamydomonas sp. UWO 241]